MLMNELHRERQKAAAASHHHPDRLEGTKDQSHLIAVLKEVRR